jgi:ribosomal protein S18 acetylase RimI-like enzyme
MSAALDEILAGHENLIEFSRQDARWQAHYEVVDANGAMFFAGESDFPAYNNGAFRTDDRVEPAEIIERAREFFSARKRGFSLWARALPVDDDLASAAADARLARVFDYPQLICRARLADPKVADGCELRWVENARSMADYAEVCAQAYTTYGSPADATRSHFDTSRVDRFVGGQMHSVVAYEGDQPLACAQVMLSHGIAGLFWVGTVESARGRGLGEAVTRAVTNRAFDLGVPNVQLQASTMGEPIYRRIGYDELYRYVFFLSGP